MKKELPSLAILLTSGFAAVPAAAAKQLGNTYDPPFLLEAQFCGVPAERAEAEPETDTETDNETDTETNTETEHEPGPETVTPAASPEAPLTLTISGYYRFETGYVSESGNGNVGGATITTRNYDFASRVRLAFDVKGRADNGLIYGARIRFEELVGEQNEIGTYDEDEAYAYILGGFGRLMLGDIESAGTLLRIYAPDDAGTGVANGVWSDFASGIKEASHFNQFVGFDPFTINRIGIWGDTADDVFSASDNSNSYSTKIVYLTSGIDLRGFTFGFSFAPEIGNRGRSYDRSAINGPNEVSLNELPSFENAVSVGINYTNENLFRGVGVAISGQYNHANSRNTNVNDYQAWMIGGQISYLGFTVGGHYIDNGNSGSATRAGLNGNPAGSVAQTGLIGPGILFDRYTAWGAGIEYAKGLWTLGANYFASQIDGIENDLVVTSETSPIARYRQSAYGIGVSYVVAPGLTIGSDIVHYWEDIARRTPIATPIGEQPFKENSGWIFALETQVNF